MKRILFTGLFTLFAFTIGFLYVEKAKLEQAISDSNNELKEQQIEIEMMELKQHLSNFNASEDMVLNYESWVASSLLAEQFFEDSDGKFKKEWGIFLAELAQQREIDPFIVYELLKTETGGTFDPTLVGPETRYGHAYGMAQFMKNTAPWIAEMAELPYEDDLLFDPLYSIQLSVVYLHYLYDQYEDWNYALTAYHRGVGGLENYIDDHGTAKSDYAVEIQENAQKLDDAVAYSN
ncbi:hypothetical protein JCM9140_939 [Halalkalibacter wakoensis JCM 9140]|uniref:Transglycosylase SLT domain-containing protein n=1 Tax=Halalkalibacter wakoensis JCM 9140 TaxID=1236970 RepID=W4PZ22_9BACI|nr:transglycosylase SLT domain-containing protein [Halalkalibacter wakoensis]GAE24972.1 hypothetical protein JCM9140_939 [Halalkalibacter wakoensis JCM 9140]